jgi:exopolysaccharide production protein ExoY
MEESFPSVLADNTKGPQESDLHVAAGSRRQAAAKRALDVIVSFGFLSLFAPLLVAFTLLVWLAQGRPILFKHKRIGKNGKSFECLKFRTMRNDAERVLDDYLASSQNARHEWETMRKLRDDPRLTPLGRILRKLSIDEVPQFINVLRGDMSLVGPRPIVESEVPLYGTNFSYYQSLRPGITGPWQVGGRSNTAYARRVQLDADYVKNWSLRTDIVILLKTVPAVLKSDGSC